MELTTPPLEIAHAGLRAMKTAALANGELHELELRMLAAARQHVLKSSFDVDTLEPITPDQVAASVAPR